MQPIKVFKYFSAAVALSYLISAVLPVSLVGPHQAVFPEWMGRGISITYFLVLAAISYGLHTRKRIYWKIIPILMGAFILSIPLGTVWSLIRLSLPVLPYLFMLGFFVIGMLFFTIWWRKQKDYFCVT